MRYVKSIFISMGCLFLLVGLPLNLSANEDINVSFETSDDLSKGFRTLGPMTTINLDLPPGWSMICLPVEPVNPTPSVLFPGARVVYGYNREIGYVRVNNTDKLEAGKGYWILLEEAKEFILTGQSFNEHSFEVNKAGWQMIGGCTFPALASIESIDSDIVVIYGYVSGSGYQRVQEGETLEPGIGYWTLLVGPAQIIIKSIKVSPAFEDLFLTDGYYRIACQQNGTNWLLDRKNTSTSAANLFYTTQWHYGDGGHFIKITHLGDNYYKLETAGLALTETIQDKNYIFLRNYNNWSTQKWKISGVGGGKYKLECKNLALTFSWDNVFTSSYTGSDKQQWKIWKIDTSHLPVNLDDYEYIFNITRKNAGKWDALVLQDKNNILIYDSYFKYINVEAIRLENCDNVFIHNITCQGIKSGKNMVHMYDCKNVTIQNSTFNDMCHRKEPIYHSNAIAAKRTDNIIIKNNKITDMSMTAIFVAENCNQVTISDNLIDGTGLDIWDGFCNHTHGIYAESPDIVIENNRIFNCYDGQAVSIRSTGTVRNNIIVNTFTAAISYWSVNPAGISSTLLIENNTITNVNHHGQNRGSGIWIQQTQYSPQLKIDNILIKNNTIVVGEGHSNGAIINAKNDSAFPWQYLNIDVTGNYLWDLRLITDFIGGQLLMDTVTDNFCYQNSGE